MKPYGKWENVIPIKERYEVRYCADDVGGSLCVYGVFDEYIDARDKAIEVSGYVVMIDSDGYEIVRNGELLIPFTTSI
jgi:hypothetical protein